MTKQKHLSATRSSTWIDTRVYAPFTGRMGTHLVSVGNLVSGNRGGGSSTTLLATIVSIDPIYLNFDMSEGDYLNFERERASRKNPLANNVDIALSDENHFDRHGTLNFLDNSSGPFERDHSRPCDGAQSRLALDSR